MKHIVSSNIAKARTARWLMTVQPLDIQSTWTETRLVIEFGGHVYPVTNGQVFQCAHCGNFDPEWKAHEVLSMFEEMYGIKPHEVEITCSYIPKD